MGWCGIRALSHSGWILRRYNPEGASVQWERRDSGGERRHYEQKWAMTFDIKNYLTINEWMTGGERQWLTEYTEDEEK